MFNKQQTKNTAFVKKPNFSEIQNITDGLIELIDKYGINQVILHLGLVANKKISKNFAQKIWAMIGSNTTIGEL